MVLRFNLSTPAEEKALAEVADTLYLDIWDFTNNWADIRLREDDVRSSTFLQITVSNECNRFLRFLVYYQIH